MTAPTEPGPIVNRRPHQQQRGDAPCLDVADRPRAVDGLAQAQLDRVEIMVAEVTDPRPQRHPRPFAGVGGRIGLQCRVEVASGRTPCPNGERLLAGLQAGGGQPAAIDVRAASTQVVGDLDRPPRVVVVPLFEVIAERQVESLAVAAARLVVQQLAQERVVEGVPLAVVAEEAGGLGLGEEAVKVKRGDGLEIGDERAVPEERRRPQQVPARPADAVEPLAQLVVEASRDQLIDGADQLAVVHDQAATLELTGDHRAHQQWVAAARLGHR